MAEELLEGAGEAQERQDPLEEAQVRRWQEEIRQALRLEEQAHREIRDSRRYLREGSRHGGANLLQSTLAALVPHVYAKEPEVAVVPEPDVRGVVPGALRAVARTLEKVLNKELHDTGIKQLGKRAVRAAMSARVAWAKVSYQRDVARDPQIERRLEDAQDNLRRVQALLEACGEEGGSREEHEARLAELQDLVAALEQQVEVVRAEGLAIDLVRAEDLLVSPEVREIADYRYAPWVAQRVWMSAEKVRETFGLDEEDLEGARAWSSAELAEGQPDGTAVAPAAGSGKGPEARLWHAVWEIWDKRTQTVYTWVDGCRGWARPPFAPEIQGEPWYPFFPLAFHWLEGERWPRSDVELLKELQEEYAETRAKYREHRRRAMPARVAASGTGTNEVRKLADPELNEVVTINVPPNQSVKDVVALLQYPPVDQALYDTSQVRADIELVSGLQDAARGAVLKAKTATEAEIMQMGLVSRVTERQDEVEEWITAMARYAAQVLLQVLTPDQARAIAGDGAAWPVMSREDIYRMLRIEVRAGSTGRPDQRREQEVWLKLLPVIQQSIVQIAQAEQAGLQPLADASRRLLQETLQRFDEGLDVDAILPQAPYLLQQQPVAAEAQAEAEPPAGDLTAA